MNWYNYIACFFTGVFFVNSLPHFIQGISGNKFPTPFAKPPGKGLSSPMLNVIWALINMSACFFVYLASKITITNKWTVIVFALGFIAMSFRLSFALSKKINYATGQNKSHE